MRVCFSDCHIMINIYLVSKTLPATVKHPFIHFPPLLKFLGSQGACAHVRLLRALDGLHPGWDANPSRATVKHNNFKFNIVARIFLPPV